MHETRTRSPSSTVVTAAPLATTVPTASCPRTVPGSTSGTSPLRMWRSVPQIVDESIFTTTSVGSWIVGSGTDSHARWPGPLKTSAFMGTPFGCSPQGSLAAAASASAVALIVLRLFRRKGEGAGPPQCFAPGVLGWGAIEWPRPIRARRLRSPPFASWAGSQAPGTAPRAAASASRFRGAGRRRPNGRATLRR